MSSGSKANSSHVTEFSLAAWITLLLPFGSAFAVDSINKNSDGVALKEFDPVAYFTEGQPTKGKKEFEYQWMGAKWYFSSAANRERFIENPRQYVPQYGGYCAYAVSKGHTADISPKAWKIVDGKLYLNNGWFAANLWGRNIPVNIEKADKNWPKILNQDSPTQK
jgi:YHS domain-containing protein